MAVRRVQALITALLLISGTSSANRFFAGWNHLDSAVGPGHDARTIRLNHYPRAVWQGSDGGQITAAWMAGLPALRIPWIDLRLSLWRPVTLRRRPIIRIASAIRIATRIMRGRRQIAGVGLVRRV